MAQSLAQLVVEAWERTLEETPDPFLNAWWIDGSRLTYREELDRQPVNYKGQLIPRIVTVRRNLRALGKPHRPPRLPE